MRHDTAAWDHWRQVRALRASPPLLAQDPDRRAVFSASLQQSEELFAAAETAGPASKPLTLFYAVSQAGRAIAAAHIPEDAWRIVGRGLRIEPDSADIAQSNITVVAKRRGDDAVSAVTRALGSTGLTGSLTVAEVWATLPELAGLPHMARHATRALEISPEGPNPLFFSSLHPARGTIIVNIDDAEQLDVLLSRYVATAGYEVIAGFNYSVQGWRHVLLNWPATPSPTATPGTKAVRALHEVAERVGDHWYLRPAMGSTRTSPHRLIRWWALLLALSSLARYHPAEWTKSLDVDDSVLAVDLEEGLRVAEATLPELIARALCGNVRLA